jgi:hypothetical protein
MTSLSVLRILHEERHEKAECYESSCSSIINNCHTHLAVGIFDLLPTAAVTATTQN